MSDHRDVSYAASRDGSKGGVGQSSSESDSENEDAEISQSGSRKRKRLMNVTCEACKQRKVRCDRDQPACGWCTRNDSVCEYKERKKPGLRAGYGRELETRLDRLENELHQQGLQLKAHLQQQCSNPGSGSAVLDTPGLAGVETNEMYNVQQPVPRRISGYQQPSSHSVLEHRQSMNSQHAFPYAATTAMPEQILQEQGSHHYSPASGTLKSPASQVQSQLQSQATYSVQEASQPAYVDPTQQLPPYDLLYSLVDLYFKHVNSWLPMLNRKTTMDTLFGPTPLEEADRVLLHAMVATSLRFSQDPRLTPDNKLHYHTHSKQRVQLYGLENSSVQALQALAILALDVTGTTNGPPGWNLLALISRSMVQLGLAAETKSNLTSPMYPSIATLRASVLPDPKSWIEDEERRRLFWTIYLLDRYATIATAFEFALDEKEIDRRLPCRDDLFAANKPVETRWFRSSERSGFSTTMPDILGSFSYHCELLGILSRIHHFLKRPIDIDSLSDVEQWQGSYRALDGELNSWHFSLPDDFANLSRLIKSNTASKNINCGWVILHAAYSMTMIRLNSSAAYPSSRSPIFAPSYSAMQRCLAAVDNIRQLCYHVVNNSVLDKLGPPFAFALWVAARVVLVHGSTMDHEVDPDIALFVSTLSQMGQHWEVAGRYSEILNRVLEEYQQSQRSSNANGGRVTPSTVKILADMRRCAYDLDFLISRQPRVAPKSYYPTRANTPAPNELGYLDVFDLFNFPRLPFVSDIAGNGNEDPSNTMGATDVDGMSTALNVPNFAVPNPETDWLFNPT